MDWSNYCAKKASRICFFFSLSRNTATPFKKRTEKRKIQASDAYVLFFYQNQMHAYVISWIERESVPDVGGTMCVCLWLGLCFSNSTFHMLTQGREEFGTSPSGWSTEYIVTHSQVTTYRHKSVKLQKTVLSTLVMYFVLRVITAYLDRFMRNSFFLLKIIFREREDGFGNPRWIKPHEWL